MAESFDRKAETFWAYYEAELEPWLARQEGQRRATLRSVRLLAAGGVAGAVIFAAVLWFLFGAHPAVAILAGGGVPLFIGIGGAWLVSLMFRGRIKLFLVPKVTAFFGYSYSHRPRGFDVAPFIANALIPRHDDARLEDSIDGTHNGVDFRLCEAVLRRRSGRTSSGSTSYKTVQRCLLLSVAVAKPFEGRTIVLRDPSAVKRVFGSQPAERVRLEDPRFEKQFEVYGTDQVEARYLMTPSFMERVAALAGVVECAAPPQLAFVEHHLLIALQLDRDRFEGGALTTPMAGRARAEALIEELRVIAGIIDTLKLSLKTHA